MLDKFIEKSKNLNLYSIVVLKNGEKIAEHHWAKEIRRNQYSATKSFTSTAVGMAIDEGLLKLQNKIIDYFENDISDNLPKLQLQRLKKLTIEDLLMMAAGYKDPGLMGERKNLKNNNWIQFALSMPLYFDAKQQFTYTNCTAYLAGVILEKAAGCSLIDYLMPRLFEPLGIPRPDCEFCPQGHVFGASGLMLTANELAKFGQLYLQNGEYNGKQLISKDWVQQATKKQINTGYGPLDNRMGYGYFFWRGSHNSYRASGMNGQAAIVLEDKNAVIAFNSNEKNTQAIRDCIWENIYPDL